jgi:hypothetical protein
LLDYFHADLKALGFPLQRAYESRSTFRNLLLQAGAQEFHVNMLTHAPVKQASDYYTRLEMQWPAMCDAILKLRLPEGTDVPERAQAAESQGNWRGVRDSNFQEAELLTGRRRTPIRRFARRVRQVEMRIGFSRVPRGPRHSAAILETFWRRPISTAPSSPSPDSMSLNLIRSTRLLADLKHRLPPTPKLDAAVPIRASPISGLTGAESDAHLKRWYEVGTASLRVDVAATIPAERTPPL